jgi:hypothetical protein
MEIGAFSCSTKLAKLCLTRVTNRPNSHSCAADNWTDHLLWVLLGLHSAAREDDSSIPAQALLSQPLILPSQFLDSPELPSDEFLTQFSRTLSAAKHYSTSTTQQQPGSHR